LRDPGQESFDEDVEGFVAAASDEAVSFPAFPAVSAGFDASDVEVDDVDSPDLRA
jgi:hypothetical protein